jgi:PAS domain S-box-containing protein
MGLTAFHRRAGLMRYSSSARNILLLMLRLVIVAVFIGTILAGSLQLTYVDHATVALLMVATIVGIGSLWGGPEALTGALIGGLGFDYYFLPPHGFGIENPQHMVALAAFLLIAVAVSQLAARSKRLMAQRNRLLNLSLEPLCICDLKGGFQSANAAMVELLGWSYQELCSSSARELIHQEDQARTDAAYQELSEGRSVVEFENRYRAKGGEWRWLSWRIAAPAAGESQVSAAARDVTQEKFDRGKLRDLAAQLMTAQEEERRRIARDLHDDVTQRLATIGIEIGLLKRDSASKGVIDLPAALARFQEEIVVVSEDLRLLSHSLHPSILEHADLAATLEAHCREFTKQHDIETTFTMRGGPQEIPHDVAVTLYRIAQESLRNVAQHSGATVASVTLAGEGATGLSLFIIDNGSGFDAKTAKSSAGLGLLSIEERARTIGASVAIESMLDAGTRLSVQVPSIIKAHEI